MLLRVAGLTSSIPGDNPRRKPPTKNTPRDKPSAPETTPPTKNTHLEITPPQRGVLTVTLTDPWGQELSENWH